MLKFALRILKSAVRFIPFLGSIQKASEPIKVIANAPVDKRRWVGPQAFLVVASAMIGIISQSPLFFEVIGLANAFTTWFLIRPKAPVGSEEREKFLPACTGVHLFLAVMVLVHMMGGPI